MQLQPRVRFTGLCVVLAAIGVGAHRMLQTSVLDNDHAAAPPRRNQAIFEETYGKLLLSFERNLGQVNTQAQFVARTRGGQVFLTNRGAVVGLNGGAGSSRAYFRMEWLGSNSSVVPRGVEELAGRANYFIGNQPSTWITKIPTYQRVKYAGAYPGIDIVCYGNHGRLEYDFVVAPGADPSTIRIGWGGVKSMKIDGTGDLVAEIPGHELRQRRPRIYQEVGGEKREVRGKYVLRAKNQVAIALEAYDRTRALVIDPMLTYSTYLGGSSSDFANAVAVDSLGSVYVTGYTFSTDFPTANPLQETNGGSRDAFVAKLSADGSSLAYSTYLGGSDFDTGRGIAVDSLGNAYVTGETLSTNFPTVNPLQATNRGGEDVFVAKLSADGSSLVYSTYLGGFGDDSGRSITLDDSGNAYVAGYTGSADFPTERPLQERLRGRLNAFVTKLNDSGSSLVYSTYLGGSDLDIAHGIALDMAGNVYITGQTGSTNFPTQRPLQPTHGGGFEDGFVTKLNESGSALVYSTYLGGSSYDRGTGIAVDSSGNAYVTGYTSSTNFPTANPLQAANAGDFDAFVAKLNDSGSALVYSTYFGGSDRDLGYGIAVDPAGNAYVTGTTLSRDFPIQNPLQAYGGNGDAFVVKLDDSGSALFYSTYLGGRGTDSGLGIAVDAAGYCYVAGFTASMDFPTENPLQGTYGGDGDAFVCKLGSTESAMARANPRSNQPSAAPLTDPPGVSRGSSSDSVGCSAAVPTFIPILLTFAARLRRAIGPKLHVIGPIAGIIR